jgi:hypothetical protein
MTRCGQKSADAPIHRRAELVKNPLNASRGSFMSTREFQLLLACATSQPNKERIKDVIQEGINWPILLALAKQHEIRPILRQSLKSVCWDSVPQTIRHELDHFYTTNVQRSLLFTAELLGLLGIFQQNGIPFAIFKGVVLSASLYGDPALREFSDLDIIVHEEDVSKVENILTAARYQPDFPDKDYRSAFLSYQGQYAFRNKQTGTSVDLHWRLSGKGEPFPLNPREIWPKLRYETICDCSIPTLAHDDLALLLAAHGTREGWRYLKWTCDFAEILRKYQDINWITVLGRAERSNCSRSLQLAMVLASTLLDAPAPPELIEKARCNSAVQQLAEKAKLRMLRAAPEAKFRQFLDGLNTHDRLRHRLWPVVTQLTTRTVGDYQAMPLPKLLWGIYHLTRPFRLMTKAAEMIVRRIT